MHYYHHYYSKAYKKLIVVQDPILYDSLPDTFVHQSVPIHLIYHSFSLDHDFLAVSVPVSLFSDHFRSVFVNIFSVPPLKAHWFYQDHFLTKKTNIIKI